MRKNESPRMTLEDMHGMKETFINAGLSRRGVATLIRANKKSIKVMRRSREKYDDQGGFVPLFGIFVLPWLIECTNFWFNPKVAITDKHKFAQARINALKSHFGQEPIPGWLDSLDGK